MTSQGSAHGRFTRAIHTRNLWAAEMAMRELGTVSLADALDYLKLLAEVKPEKLELAAVRWHGGSSAYMTDRYRHLLAGHEAEAARLLDAYLERADTQTRLAQVTSK